MGKLLLARIILLNYRNFIQENLANIQYLGQNSAEKYKIKFLRKRLYKLEVFVKIVNYLTSSIYLKDINLYEELNLSANVI